MLADGLLYLGTIENRNKYIDIKLHFLELTSPLSSHFAVRTDDQFKRLQYRQRGWRRSGLI